MNTDRPIFFPAYNPDDDYTRYLYTLLERGVLDHEFLTSYHTITIPVPRMPPSLIPPAPFSKKIFDIDHSVPLAIITLMGLPGTWSDLPRHVFHISIITAAARFGAKSIPNTCLELTPKEAFVTGLIAGGPTLIINRNIADYLVVATMLSLGSIAINRVQEISIPQVALWVSLLYLNWETPTVCVVAASLIALMKRFENRVIMRPDLIFKTGELSLIVFLIYLAAIKNRSNINTKFISYLCLVTSNILLLRKVNFYVNAASLYSYRVRQFDFKLTSYIIATTVFSVLFSKSVPTFKFMLPTAAALIAAHSSSYLTDITRSQWILIGFSLVCFPEKVLGLDVSANCADVRYDCIEAPINLVKAGVREAVGLFKYVFRL